MKNSKKDILSFIRAKEHADKIIESACENINIEECKELGEYLAKNPHMSSAVSNLTNDEHVSDLVNIINKYDKERSIDKLSKKLHSVSEDMTMRKKRLSLYIKTIAVASAIAIVSMLVFNPTSNDKPDKIVLSSNNVEYDFTQPTLILASGEVVSVSDIVAPLISGNSEVNKTLDNKLVYREDKELSYNKDSVSINKLIIPLQSSYTVVLSDDTEVMLNSNTIFEYPTKFNNKNREVKISGEGYFKVSKSNLPFIVNTDNGQVVVYGTEFNLKNNKDLGLDLVLIEGSVGYKKEPHKEVKLLPNQRLVMNNKLDSIFVTDVNTSDFIGWRDNMFIYKEESIYHILADVAQWYGINFKLNVMNNSSMYTFMLDRSTSLENTIKHLSNMSNITIINDGKGVYIVE